MWHRSEVDTEGPAVVVHDLPVTSRFIGLISLDVGVEITPNQRFSLLWLTAGGQLWATGGLPKDSHASPGGASSPRRVELAMWRDLGTCGPARWHPSAWLSESSCSGSSEPGGSVILAADDSWRELGGE